MRELPCQDFDLPHTPYPAVETKDNSTVARGKQISHDQRLAVVRNFYGVYYEPMKQ